jgi:hypothetical protein
MVPFYGDLWATTFLGRRLVAFISGSVFCLYFVIEGNYSGFVVFSDR